MPTLPNLLTRRRAVSLETRQVLIEVGPRYGHLSPDLVRGLDGFRRIQTSRLDPDYARAGLGLGKERRAALRAELACYLPAAVGDFCIAPGLSGANSQTRCIHTHTNGIRPSRGLATVRAMTVRRRCRCTLLLIPHRPTKTTTFQNHYAPLFLNKIIIAQPAVLG